MVRRCGIAGRDPVTMVTERLQSAVPDGQRRDGTSVPHRTFAIHNRAMAFPSLPLSILLGVIGPWQIVLVVVVLMLFFGGKKIPELMRGLGQGMKEFKNAKDGIEEGNKDKP
jgi:sec-independent protein translocase protein TatA